MSELIIKQSVFLLPEIILFLGVVLLLMVGLYGGKHAYKIVQKFAYLLLLVCIVLLIYGISGDKSLMHMQQYIFNGMLVLDFFSQFTKLLLLIGALLALILSSYWLRWLSDRKFEFYILLLLATLGMMLMVSANNMISVYMGLELASLSLYILAAFRRDSLRSTEAGVKYFVLGSLASGMMLFGISFVYGFTGSTDFGAISQQLQNMGAYSASDGNVASLGVLLGLVMIIVGFCFKVSAVPFHMWTPDVYEGAPTPVTAFFAVAPKIASVALFARILIQPFGEWMIQWQQIIIFVSAASMMLGAFVALAQTNIKRLLAYSSIGHIGYALMGIAAGSISGIQGVLIYLTIYMFMSAGAFACVLLMQKNGEYIEDITQLSGLSRHRPYMAMALAIFMFSLAGIPPLAGFFGKLYIFMAALEAGLIYLAIIGLLSSVVAAFYYLRIVKLMYFDEEKDIFNFEITSSLKYLLVLCTAITVFFFLFPAPLVETAREAASALWL